MSSGIDRKKVKESSSCGQPGHFHVPNALWSEQRSSDLSMFGGKVHEGNEYDNNIVIMK